MKLIKKWLAKRKEDKENAIALLMLKRGTMANKILAEEASRISRKVIMEWLDTRRINHCQVCHENRSLRKLGNSYYCGSHYDEFQRLTTLQEEKEK